MQLLFEHLKNMNIKMNGRILIIMSMIFVTLDSCVMDKKTFICVKNHTNDTLLIELTESDTLDNWIYKGKHPDDANISVLPGNTNAVDIPGRNVIINDFFYALPDSTLYADSYIFNLKDTCYIYAIKWQIVRHYSPEQIRVKRLYDRRTLTKKDFNNNNEVEYRPEESARSH